MEKGGASGGKSQEQEGETRESPAGRYSFLPRTPRTSMRAAGFRIQYLE